jgi:hypothetical protein
MVPAGIVRPIFVDLTVCAFAAPGGPHATPCSDPMLGDYFPLDDCYWKLAVPQPPAGDPLWQGHTPIVDGRIFQRSCPMSGAIGLNVTLEFSSVPPPSSNQDVPTTMMVKNIVSGLQALAVKLITPQIQGDSTAPPNFATKADSQDPVNGRPGLVGLHAWLSTNDLLSVVGPLPTVTLLSGIATLSLFNQRMYWNTGDNDTMVTCTGTGVKYNGSTGTPQCGYVYVTPGTYGLSAKSVWWIRVNIPLVLNGTILVVRNSALRFLSIDELQVVTE